MKTKLIFIIPTLLLLGFLAIKPPAIGNESNQVVVTPTSTATKPSQPLLRDFDDDGREPPHLENKGENNEGDKERDGGRDHGRFKVHDEDHELEEGDDD